MNFASLLLLLWSLVEVHSQQTFPYVSFMSQTLANHSYVDISQVGNDGSGSDSVQCITDLATCCSGGQGIHRGDWYFPDGTIDCHSLEVVISMSFVQLRELTYIVGTMLTHQLVSIAVTFQPMLSMVIMTSQ